MKIYKSGYRNHWISPYTVINHVFFWTDWSKCARKKGIPTLEDEANYVEHPEWVDRIADYLTPVSQAIQWVLDRVHPQINYVKIDRYDTWSMDHTLADIILPMLRQLKATKHGYPLVDDADAPEYMRSHMSQPKEHEWDWDDLAEKRWDWVLDEMIFAFECKVDDSWQDAFREGEHDIVWVPVDKDGNKVPKGEHKYYQMDKGPNDTYKCDYEGMKKVEERIQNGLKLFGKYYQALWD